MKKIGILTPLALLAVLTLSVFGLNMTQAATTYTAAQVAPHNIASDCWMIISGKVYNLTAFIPIHPGGSAMIPFCGQDATSVFNSIHSQAAFNLLPTYLIGDLTTTSTTLTAPSGLFGSATQNSVVLNWTASGGGTTPITYTITRNSLVVGTTTVSTFTDIGLASSTSYDYVVKATDSTTPTPQTASSPTVTVMTLSGSNNPPPVIQGDDGSENEQENADVNERESENEHVQSTSTQSGERENERHQSAGTQSGERETEHGSGQARVESESHSSVTTTASRPQSSRRTHQED